MIHHVFANKCNIGDWLSARGIQTLLAPVPLVEHLCDEPFVDRTLARLALSSPEDLIVIGGGGLFMDYFTSFWKGFRPFADRNAFCIWGVGYCDWKRAPSRAPVGLLQQIVAKARVCVLRDALSVDYLQGCHLPPPVACPTLSVVDPPPAPGFGVLHVDNYGATGAHIYEATDAYAREFAKTTLRPYRATNNAIPHGSEPALQQICELYAASDIVLSSALHGCIIAVAMGRKVLAISADRKLESFMQAAGLAEWVCDINDIDSLPAKLATLKEQQPRWNFLRATRQQHRAIASQILAEVGRRHWQPNARNPAEHGG